MKSCLVANIIFFFFSIGPGPSPEGIKLKLLDYYRKYPQEKIYVQTDKQSYLAGQSIWYKIYSLSFGVPSDLSKIVYIQLINSDGKIMIKKKFPLEAGTATGDFQLPDSLTSGVYQLRCFTKWMMNFDELALFHRDLFVKNPSDRDDKNFNTVKPGKQYEILFFPEGGDLINGVNSTVAFKATDEYGLPVTIHGKIFDEKNNLIDSFKTFHDGMGKFDFLNEATHDYYAMVYWPDNSSEKQLLPRAENSGINIKLIDQSKDAFAIKVVYHETVPGEFQQIVLVASQKNGKVATYPLVLDPGINTFNIDTKQFATGILRVTIFDSNGVPQSERIVFINHGTEPEVELVDDTISAKPKSKSVFSLQLKNLNQPINDADISIAVTDADQVESDSLGENICSSFLLSSELKGIVRNPGYYFLNNSDSIKAALDLVMMTNGWRHFEWKKILGEETVPLKYAVEDSLYIRGKLLGYTTQTKDTHPVKMIITENDSTRFMGYISPDSNGNFIVQDYVPRGRSVVYLQQKETKAKEKRYKLKFLANSFEETDTAHFVFTPDAEEELVNSYKNALSKQSNERFRNYLNMLKPVTVRGNPPTAAEQLAKKYVSPFFQAGVFYDIDLVNNFYPNSMPLFDFMMGKFPGLSVSGTENSPLFSYRNSAVSELLAVKSTVNNDVIPEGTPTTAMPYFYVNETPSSYQDIVNIRLSDVAMIRFVPPPASMAPFNGGVIGVIAIYLKKYDEGMKNTTAIGNSDKYIFDGYSVTRQFFSPNYDIDKAALARADNRETLYWNPGVKIDKSGRAKLSFFNSDHAKRFRILMEGVSRSGDLIYFNKVVDQAK